MGEQTNYNDDENKIRPDMAIYNEGDQQYPEKEVNGRRILYYCGLYLALMLIVIFVAQTGISFIIGIIAEVVSYDLSDSSWFIVAVTAISVAGVGFPVFAMLMRKIPDSKRGEVRDLSYGQFIGFFIVCVGAAYIANIIGLFISSIMEMVKGIEVINPLEDFIFNSNMVVTMIYAVIIAPIVEELVFRKILLDKLRRFGDSPAILYTGIAFGLFHLNLPQFFYATVLGVLFGYITIRTNRIIYSIILHMMLNFIGAGLVPLLMDKGSGLGAIIIVIWFFGTMTIGSVLVIVNSRRIELNKPKKPLVRNRDYILNPGSILFGIICIVVIVMDYMI